MEKENRRFELFLNDIHPDAAFGVTKLHGRLVEMGCAVKLQEAKNGHVVSYHDPAGKRVVANFVSRKSGPVICIYGDGVASYEAYL